MPLNKNDIIQLNITGITSEGNGVGKANDGMSVFVPATAVGDTVNVRIIKVLKKYAVGKIENIVTPSPDREENKCPVFPKCGGCVFRHINYEAELKIKEQFVIDAMERIGGFRNVPIKPIIGGNSPDHYRNKAQIPIGTAPDGKLTFGYYSRHSHRIAECSTCLLHPECFTKIMEILKKWADEYCISAYNEETKTGLLRHLYMRYGEKTKELMICIVATKNTLPYENILVKRFEVEFENLQSVIINVNDKDTNVILGENCRVISGREYIYDELCGLKFKLSPLSFFQVNRTQAELLYKKAINYASFNGTEILLDLYCGTGTIGLSAARFVKKVIGVEIVEQAVADAVENAETNGITNAEFICGDAAKAAYTLDNRGEKPDVIIVDPPRKGCSADLLNIISSMNPDRIIYVSCDAATQARDIRFLYELGGYLPVEITPVNMFPRTGHVESVCLMSKVKK